MKILIFKAILVVLVALGASNYLIYLQTGKAPFDFDDLRLPALPTGLIPTELPKVSFKLPDISLDSLKSDKPTVSAGKDTIYKWVDKNGVTQLSSEPPPAQQNAQVLVVDPNANIIQSAGQVSDPETEDKQETATAPAQLLQGQVYSPSQVKKLMDDAKNVQQLLNDRYENQRQIIEGQ
ncbi:MAG: DUF4124 domain-containing protein [Motiliproteus sp.]